jgi:hypothetical protein
MGDGRYCQAFAVSKSSIALFLAVVRGSWFVVRGFVVCSSELLIVGRWLYAS